MKKKPFIIIPIILITLTLLIIIGTNKQSEEYKLIELTGNELTNTILGNDKISITYALYNDYDMKSEDFLKDLEKTARQTHENIYYVNTSHSTFEFSEIISSITSTTTDSLSYFVFQDGELIISNTYKSFKSLYKDLNGKKYDTKIKYTSEKEKKEALTAAENLYNEGDIAGAYNKLSIAWNTKAAKEHFQNNPNYLILGSWEIFEPDDDLENTKYINYVFLNYKSKLAIGAHETKIDGFEKPTSDKYVIYDFQIKDGYIYTKQQENTKYSKEYKITKLNKYSLILTSEKNNKTYNFQYGY